MKQVQLFLLLLISLTAFFSCMTDSDETKVYDLSIRWNLNKNYNQDKQLLHDATFFITNNSNETLDHNWELFWNQSPRGLVSLDSSKHVEMAHINGDFFTMRGLNGFQLAPNETVKINYTGAVWLIKESDAPLGVYAVFNPGEDQKIKVIKDMKIMPFTEPEQINRTEADQTPIPTAQNIFEENKSLSLLPEDQLYKVIPSPKSYKKQSGNFNFPISLTIHTPEATENEAAHLLVALRGQYNINGKTASTFGEISLKIDANISKPEGYRLIVQRDKIEIIGHDNAGVFYGMLTLLNLIEKDNNKLSIPACIIEDSPAYAYRGIHIDVGRNFQSKETLLKMIDVLARYKVNKVVLGMTEDEGWRLAIDGLPELTDVGSKRAHPTKDNANLFPSYGSGPFVNNVTGTGFYTREDFKEIIKYAHDRHVDIIPMVNFPGHARSAIVSMEYRYDRLMKEGKEDEAKQYRLKDPNDKSTYLSAQNFNDNVTCVCQESTYEFYEFVVDDILEMYEEAGVPIYMFHTGGDEVPRGVWEKSPICEAYLKTIPPIENPRNFQAHFFDRVTKVLQSKGLRIGGWEEVLMNYDENDKWYTNTDFTDRQVYPYIWNNLWGQQDLGYKMANRGYPIILCNVTNFYFDLSYDKDPREPGLYWGGFVNSKGPFSFIPQDLFKSTVQDPMGNKFDTDKDFETLEQITPRGLQNIAGLQAQLWSETVKGQDMIESYVIPKLFGFAQRSWQGQANWGNQSTETKRNAGLNQDWNRFANTLSQNHFSKLDELNGGYHYHIPKAGITVENGKLMMNTGFPGMEIRYSIDGSDPTMSSKVYEGPVDFTEGTVIAKVFNGKGRSGLSTTYSTEKEKIKD